MNESDWGFFLHDCEMETLCVKESGHLAWCMLNLNGETQIKSSKLAWVGVYTVHDTMRETLI